MNFLFIKEKRGSKGVEGTGIYLLNLCKYFNSINQKYLILYNSDDEYSKLLIENNINFKNLNFPSFSLYNNLKFYKLYKIRNKIKKIIRDQKISHLILQDPYLQIFLKKNLNIPVICHQHSAFDLNFKIKSKNFYHYLHMLVKNYYNKCRRVEKVICVSKSSYETSKNKFYIPENKLIINNYGIDNLLEQKTTTKKTNKITVLSVASILYDKGVEDFCEVAKNVNLRLKKNKFNFIFVGGYRSKIYHDNIIQKYGQYVKFVGLQKNVLKYYDKADIFLFLSHRESAGLVLMEAMRHKLFIIASNIFGINEVIKNNHSGILVDYRDHLAIANILIETAKDLQKINDFKVNAYKRFINMYTIEKSGKKFLDIFK